MAKPFASLYRILFLASTALLACIVIFLCTAYLFMRETDPLLGALEHEQIIAYLRTDDPKHITSFLSQAHIIGILANTPEDLGLPQASSYSLAIIKRNEDIAWIAAPKLPIIQEHVRSSDPELTKTIIANALRNRFPLHSLRTSIPRTSKSLWVRSDFFSSLPASNLRDLINTLLRDAESIAVTWGNERTIITLQGIKVDVAHLPLNHPLSLLDSQCQITLAIPKTFITTLNTNLERENPSLALGIRGVLDAKWKESIPGTVSTSTISALLDGPLSFALNGSGRTLLGFTKSPQRLDTIFSEYHAKDVPTIARRIRLSKEYTWTDLMIDPKQQEVRESRIGTFILKERTQTQHPLAIAYPITMNPRKNVPYAVSNSGSLLTSLLSHEMRRDTTDALAEGHCAIRDIVKELDRILPFLLSDVPSDLRQSLFSIKAHTFRVQQSPSGLRIVIENL